ASSVPATGNTYQVNGVALGATNLSFTALSSSQMSSVYGQAVTLTATIRANTPSPGTPIGSVDFFDSTTGTDLGSVLLNGGSASLVTSALGAGDHLIRATYSGDNNCTFSLDALTQSVSRATLTVVVSGYSGGTYDGSAHTRTVTVTGVPGQLFSTSLTGTN